MPNIILIAEDYDDTRSFMVFILVERGFTVYEATNGREAIEAARDHHPDLIFMDLAMPEMNGLEATRLIRASEGGIAHTPIIAVTAYDILQQEQALEAGCDQVISKPVDFDEIDQAIEKFLPC